MKLYHKKFGKGPAMIIIHGLYGSSDNWISLGKKFAANFEVYLIDQRNHGRSGHSDQHNYQLMSDDLMEFMHAKNIERAILLGHSMGGKTAMYFARNYPEMVSHLIVADISPLSYKNNPEQAIQYNTHKTILESLASIPIQQLDSRKKAEDILKKAIPQKRIVQFLLKNLHRDKSGAFSWKINLDALIHNVDNILDGFLQEEFEGKEKITGFPVLFLRGENSGYIETKDIEAIQFIFPYAEIETISGAGHWMHAEKPQEFFKKINNFILEES